MNENINTNSKITEEKLLNPINGLVVLVVNVLLIIASIAGIIFSAINLSNGGSTGDIVLLVICSIYVGLISWIIFMGIKVLKPNEAYVLTLFGSYYGTIKKEGIFFVNPFAVAFNPTYTSPSLNINVQGVSTEKQPQSTNKELQSVSKKISTKVLTLDNPVQKINDQLGNPVQIGIVIIWKVVNPTQAVFNVDNYKQYLSIQGDSVLRNITRMYPYDISTEGDEKSLRGSSQEIAEKLKAEIQEKVSFAGIEIQEAKITSLAYAPEIAAAMLQRQQASAIIDARRMIVEGAVSMVQLALEKLDDEEIANLDEERKAAMISNLMVVLCANKEAQPIVNSGSIY